MVKAKELLKYILSLLLAALLVWFALRSVDWTEFWEGLKLTRWLYLVPFLLASIGALLFRALRWRTLLGSAGFHPRLLTVWDANNVGNLTNLAVPASGEFVRCGFIAGKEGFADVLGTAVMERAWDVLAILLMIVLSLFLDWDRFSPFFIDQVWTPLSQRFNVGMWLLILLLVLLLVLFFWAVRHYRNRNKLCRRISNSLSAMGRGLGSFGKMEHKGWFLVYTLGIWVMYVLMCFSIQKAIPDLSGLDLVDALFFTAVGNVASVIPVPGGIGAYHYLLALSVATIFGGKWETGILFATLQHELHAVLVLILGIASYSRLNLKRRSREEMPAQKLN